MLFVIVTSIAVAFAIIVLAVVLVMRRRQKAEENASYNENVAPVGLSIATANSNQIITQARTFQTSWGINNNPSNATMGIEVLQSQLNQHHVKTTGK